MIILNYCLSNPEILTETVPSFKGSTVNVKRAIFFKTEQEANDRIEIEDFQCAAIVKIINTFSD